MLYDERRVEQAYLKDFILSNWLFFIYSYLVFSELSGWQWLRTALLFWISRLAWLATSQSWQQRVWKSARIFPTAGAISSLASTSCAFSTSSPSGNIRESWYDITQSSLYDFCIIDSDVTHLSSSYRWRRGWPPFRCWLCSSRHRSWSVRWKWSTHCSSCTSSSSWKCKQNI